MDYLGLTNRAIEESGMDLDLLTASDFATPPRTIMYDRIKRWVNTAYKQILMKRFESYLLNERAVITVRPRIRIYKEPLVTLNVNDEMIGRDSGVRFLIRRITTDALDPTGDVYLDLEYVTSGENHLLIGESLSRITPNPVTTAGQLRGIGGYTFAEDLPYLDQIHMDSVSYNDRVDNLVNGTPGNPYPVPYVIWDDWLLRSNPDDSYAGPPQYATRGPEGAVYFWPRLDKAYDVRLNYSRRVVDMVNYSDQPYPIPPKYQDAIYWLAVMKYAKFERKDNLYFNAREEYRFYNNLMEAELLPPLQLTPNRFWA